MAETKQPFYLLPVRAVLQELRVRVDTGLTHQEVKRRRGQSGFNSMLRHKPRSAILVFFDRLRDPLVLLLLAAGILSLIVHDVADAVIITVAILLDTLFSLWQAWRTQRTTDRLRQHIEQRVTVIRDQHRQHIPARELTVGDIIELQAGQKVPADARVVYSSALCVQEAALTGESEEVTKSASALKSRTPLGNRRNMVYLGTTIMSGQAQAVVTAIGTSTEFGKIAQLLKTPVVPPSPLRRVLHQASQWIAWSLVLFILIISGGAIATGETFAAAARMVMTLIVSAIPEDLTIILTIVLTVGAIRILKRQGVVRELSSGETVGAATVICIDTTGLLTAGNMTADQFDSLSGRTLFTGQPPDGRLEQLAYQGFALATDAHRLSPATTQYVGSATERAALAFVEKAGFIQGQLRRQWRLRDSLAFDPTWQYRATLHDHPTKRTQTIFVSGAPESVLERCSHRALPNGEAVPLTSGLRHEYQQKLVAHANQGQRLIASAVRDNVERAELTHQALSGLTWLGILTITDPIRPDVMAAIRQTQFAGVAVKVITGDFAATARAVAQAVGLSASAETVLDGALLHDMSDAELARIVDDIVVFARIEPLDKQRIVRALQKQGHVVAMTGDGINDAVALNAADIGIAMGSGKDIAKDAAKLVLLDDNFNTIIAAIREGRIIRDNVRKAIGFLLVTNVAEVAIFVVSQLLRLPLPFLPAHILWINLVTDGTAAIALSLEPPERNVMARPPEDPRAALMNKPLVQQVLLAGFIMTAAATALYLWGYRYQGFALPYMRTVIFSFVALTALLSTWSYRSLWEPTWRRGLFRNPWLFVSAGFSFVLQLVAVYSPTLQKFFHTVPIHFADWEVIISLALLTVFLIDIRKFLFPLPNGRK